MRLIRNNNRRLAILGKLRLKWANYRVATGKYKRIIKAEIDKLSKELDPK